MFFTFNINWSPNEPLSFCSSFIIFCGDSLYLYIKIQFHNSSIFYLFFLRQILTTNSCRGGTTNSLLFFLCLSINFFNFLSVLLSMFLSLFLPVSLCGFVGLLGCRKFVGVSFV